MAFYSFFPTKDTTIYRNTPLLNTGIDEILELQKVNYDYSRILIDFNIDDISEFITNNNIANKEFYLKLFTVDSREIPLVYNIEVYPISESWDMGIGKKNITPSNNIGANWNFRKENILWGGDTSTITGSITDFVTLYNATGSITGSILGNINAYFVGTIYSGSVFTDINGLVFNYAADQFSNQIYDGRFSAIIEGTIDGNLEAAFISGNVDLSCDNMASGGTYILPSICTQSFNYENTDLNINVTSIVNDWLSGSITPNGFLIKMSDAEESQSSFTNFQFFSKDTHTIYPPKLEIRYDDSSFITSSLISTYTQSYIEHVFISSKTQLTDLTPFYVDFTVPLFPRNAHYNFADTWTYTEIKISQSLDNYFKSYTNTFIDGEWNGRLTGDFTGEFTGSLSGSFNNTQPIIINAAYISTITESLDINYSGSIIGEYNGSSSALTVSSYICGTINDSYLGTFSGSLDSFTGIYTGSVNGIYTSGSGTISTSTFNGVLDGTISNNITGSFSGLFTAASINGIISGTIMGNVVGDFTGSLDGKYSGSVGLPFVGYVELENNLNSTFDNLKIHATMSGDFKGYANGYLSNWTSNYEYYATGSRVYSVTESIDLLPLTDNDIIIYVKNQLFNYKQNSNNLIRVIGRQRYPKRTYWPQNTYLDIKYLPTSSYYSIVDAQHDELIVPFDNNYTKLSCDENGNYFMLNTEGLQPERIYRMVFKVVRGNKIQMFDNNYLFKVVR